MYVDTEDCVLVTAPYLANVISTLNPEDVFSLHMDEYGHGKGAYYIFNNTTSETESKLAGDHMRSVAHLEDNPQLGKIKTVLQLALSICKKLGLCKDDHEAHVMVRAQLNDIRKH